MRTQKVLLYNPRTVFYTMPLGLLAIASQLDRRRFEVILIDGRLEVDPLRALRPHLHEAVCLGMTVLTGRPIRDALHVARQIKALRPDLPVVWGGWHPSLFPTACLDEPAVDVTVQGQGEETFRELVEQFAQGHGPENVAGCAYRREGMVHGNSPRPLQDMNTYAPADYELIPVAKYYHLKRQRQLDYVSSTGCHFRCAFCADPQVFRRKWTALAPARMGEELEALWHRHRFSDLHLQDETFFTYRDRVVAVAEEFLRRDLRFSWTATMRADQGTRLSDEDFAVCKRSGLRRVLIGVESGSQEMLQWMKKDITIEQILLAAGRCVRHDLAVDFPMIVGFPDESDESVWQTLHLAKRLRAMSPKFKTQIFFYQPYPGSPIAAAAEARGFTMPRTLEEWADFDFVGSSGPWVSRQKWQLIQRFKFYSRHAWDGREEKTRYLLQALARWRCRRDVYGLPLEKWLAETLRSGPQLS